jgi:Phospholipase/Carboxylesterase
MRSNKRLKPSLCFLLAMGFVLFAAPVFSGDIVKDLPGTIDPGNKYLFFLHGNIVEEKGVVSAKSKEYGFYEYKKILKVLSEHGFTVISEARGSETTIKPYAQKIAAQVAMLVEKGVPPKNITVAGFSKGGKITLVSSSLIANESVNYVVLAGCIRKSHEFIDKFALDLKGRVLSIVDYNDKLFSSCENMFKNSTGGLEHKELILKVGSGHGVFYTPKDLWLQPMMDWIR